MKTISTVRFRPKPEHFDFIADQLKKRADHWASRGTTAKVYLVQDDDELIFQIILDGMDTLIENDELDFYTPLDLKISNCRMILAANDKNKKILSICFY